MGRIIYSDKSGTKVMLEMPRTGQTIADLGLDPSGDVQAFATRRAAERMDKYVPFRTGVLRGTVDYTSDPTQVEYVQEYARFLYFGRIMRVNPDGTGSTWASAGGTKYISSTGKDMLDFSGAPQRGAFWDEKMMATEGDQFFKEIQDYSDKKRQG